MKIPLKNQKFWIPASARMTNGFTLMEVMVAVSIFAIVVTVGIGSLLTINSSYRKSQTDRQALDSLTFSLESMSRRLRTAIVWDPNIVSGSAIDHLAFTDQDGAEITYFWDPSKSALFMDYQCDGTCTGTLPDSTGLPYRITPDNVTIDKFSFLPFTDGGQSYVQINVQGTVTNAKEVSKFSFQTGVSKRTLDTP